MSTDLDNSSILDNRYLKKAVVLYSAIFGLFCLYSIFEFHQGVESVGLFHICTNNPGVWDMSQCAKLVVGDLPFLGQVIFNSSLTVPFVIGVAILVITFGWISLDRNRFPGLNQ